MNQPVCVLLNNNSLTLSILSADKLKTLIEQVMRCDSSQRCQKSEKRSVSVTRTKSNLAAEIAQLKRKEGSNFPRYGRLSAVRAKIKIQTGGAAAVVFFDDVIYTAFNRANANH